MKKTEIETHNKTAWNMSVDSNDRWTVPVSDDEIARAKEGQIRIILTPKTAVPAAWLGDVSGKRILALASGGGQQAPLLAAAGANVVVLDLAEKQLLQDEKVAKKHGLPLDTVCQSAQDPWPFANSTFDLIVNPVSNCFFSNLENVHKESFRVLKPGGRFMFGFTNPVSYCFDFEKANQGEFTMRYGIPYSDLESLNETERARFVREETPLEFGHSLSTQLGDLLKAGFQINDLYEDYWDSNEPINKFFPQFVAVLATKAE